MNKIIELRNEIHKHNQLYAKGEPIITDTEYDKLYQYLVKLENENPDLFDQSSPTQTITPIIVDKINKSKHRNPMLSLNDVNTIDALEKFLKEYSEVLMQYKMDGITIVLSYENGILIKAVTRGNGFIGDDLTHNILQIKNIPKTIHYKGTLEVRGEVILPFKEFNEQNINGEYSNPRNTVAGAIRRHDSRTIINKGFKVIVFNLEYSSDLNFTKDSEALHFLKEQGFETVNSKTITLKNKKDMEETIQLIKYFEEHTRKDLPFMIDGLVFKVNNLEKRKEIGTTGTFPKWALAYKFKSLNATTKLRNVIAQVGKTGQITPVAVFDEVVIDNVKINRATLSNFNIIKEKDIRNGDTILVERANDVIPQVVKSFSELRDGSEEIIQPPTNCPVCKTPTQFEGAHLYCFGLECQSQLEGKIRHFAKRDAMNIDSLGEKTASILHKEGLVKSITDIYKLKDKKKEFVNIEGFGETSYERLINGIEESKNRELHHLLYALGIHNIGRRASRDLANHFKSLEYMIAISNNKIEFKEELLNVNSFGEIMSQIVIDFFNVDENIKTMKELIELGLNSIVKETDEPVIDTSSKINGKTFVITGKVYNYTNRKELTAEIESLGGKVTGSVTGNTDYLINNDKESNTGKNKRAKELGISIISEDEFISMK